MHPVGPADAAGGHRAVQEFRKCIECFSARTLSRPSRSPQATTVHRPRFLIYVAALEMHRSTPTTASRAQAAGGIGTVYHQVLHPVCPEEIQITDNGIIPLRSGS